MRAWHGKVSEQAIAEYIDQARNSPRLNSMFANFSRLADGTDGRPHTCPELDQDLIGHDRATLRYSAIRQEYSSPFNRHFIASVPYALEEQCRLGTGLLEYCLGTSASSVYTLGDGAGVTARALARASEGRIHTLNCSPNPENHREFASNHPDSAHFFTGPFFDLSPERRAEIGGGVFGDRFDVIVEDTTFQMYGHARVEPVALASRHLKPEGVLILMEKLACSDPAEFAQREQQKDVEFKSRFFSPEAIAGKRRDIVSAMDSQLATLAELTDAVSAFLDTVVVTWNCGNFYTVAASNCESRLRRLVAALTEPAVPPEFRYERLPLVLAPSPSAATTDDSWQFRPTQR